MIKTYVLQKSIIFAKYIKIINSNVLVLDRKIVSIENINVYENCMKEILKAIQVNYNMIQRIHLGTKGDGGYIIAHPSTFICSNLYSYGVENNIDFEIDYLKTNRNNYCYAYDHTVDFKSQENNIIFTKEGLSDKKEDMLNTLQNHLKINKNTATNLILKLDIEGYEWRVLDNIDIIFLTSHFKQIIIEFHRLSSASDGYTVFKKLEILKRIKKYYNIFHIHHNNYSPIDNINNTNIPVCVEITYLRKKDCIYESSKTLSKNPFYKNCWYWKTYKFDNEVI